MNLTKKKIIIGVSGLVFVTALTIGITVLANRPEEEIAKKMIPAEEKVYDVLSPVPGDSLTAVYCIAGRLNSVKNKKIGIIVNNKRTATLMSDTIAERLKEDEASTCSVYNIGENVQLSDLEEGDTFFAWLNEIDAVVLVVGDCVNSTITSIYNAAFIEERGKPTVTLCNKNYKETAKSAADEKLIPSLRVIYENIEEESNNSKNIETDVVKLIPDIKKMLTKAITAEEKSAKLFREDDLKIAFSGTFSEIDLYYYQNGWTDGLPFMLPTQEAVDEMLKGTDKERNERLGTIENYENSVTVEDVAVNAVMAGCRPIDFPIVLAAVECLLNSDSGYSELISSLSSCSPFITISGTIQDSLEINNSEGAYGSGNSSNSTIGRALNLVIRNICGLNGQVKDNGIYGNTGNYSNVIGEYNPGKLGLFNWSRLGEQTDSDYSENVVSLAFENSYSYHEINNESGKTIADNLYSIALSMNSKVTTFVITTAMAQKMENDGFDSSTVINTLFYNLSQNNPFVTIEDVGILMIESEETNGVLIVSNSYGVGERVFANIELPKDWENLLGEYTYNRYEQDTAVKNDGNVGAIDAKDEKLGEIFYTDELIDNTKYYLREETDGLPVVIATVDRVNKMLEGTDYAPDKVIGKLGEKEITVRMVAVNATMAGALPIYMPVIISTVEKLCEDAEQTENIIYGKNELNMVFDISGDIVNDIRLNDQNGVLNPGQRANATIGRTINFIKKNIVDSKELKTYGSTSDISVVVAEQNEYMPEGFKNNEDNIVSMSYALSSEYYMMSGLNSDEIISSIIEGVKLYATGQTKMLITSNQARIIEKAGYTRQTFIDYICAQTGIKDTQLDIAVVKEEALTGVLFLSSGLEMNTSTCAINTPKEWDKLIKQYSSYQILTTAIPEKINIVKMPDKKIYVADAEKFDSTGIKVEAIYSDGAVSLIPDSQLNYTLIDKLALTDTKQVVSYKGVSAEIDIKVKPRVVTQLIISKNPSKTKYKSGEAFDKKGLEVTALYNSGHSHVLSEDEYEIIAHDKLSDKENSITLKYGEASTVLNLSVDGKKEENSNDIIKISDFSAELVEGKVCLKVNISGDGDYKYQYYVTEKDWNLYTPAIDDEGNQIINNSEIETESEIRHSIEWYDRHFVSNNKGSIVSKYSDKYKIVTDVDGKTTRYFFVTVKDSYGNTATASTMYMCDSNETNEEKGYNIVRVRQYKQSSTVPYLYVWDNDQNPLNGEWPGTAMIKDEELGDNWYQTRVNSNGEPYNFIVTESTGSTQTSDMTNNKNDAWAVINKPVLSKSENCITLSNENTSNSTKEVKIHIKTYSDTSNIPYIYAWKTSLAQLTDVWPGKPAIKDITLGENWYTLSIVPDGTYGFIVTNALGDEQTMDLTGYDNDVWVVITKSNLNTRTSCISVYRDQADVVENNRMYVKQADNCNEIPYLYVNKATTEPLGAAPGLQMERYHELRGNWFISSFNTKGTYSFALYNKIGSHKSDMIDGIDGDMEVKVNSYDENALTAVDNQTAYSNIDLSIVE